MRILIPVSGVIQGRVVAAIALTLTCAGVRADDAAVKRSLDAVNRQLQIATVRRDGKAVLALMTPDFMMKPYKGGWLNRSQTERKMRATWVGIVAYRDWSYRIRDLVVKGNQATAMMDERLRVDVKEKNGATRTVAVETVSRNVWKRTQSGWKFHRIEDLKANVAASGVSFVPVDRALRKPGGVLPGTKGTVMTEDAARRMLEAAYANSRKAFRARNASSVMALALPEYVVEYPSSTMRRWQVERELKLELKTTRSVGKWTSRIDSIVVTKDTITALVSESKESTLLDPRGKPHSSVVEDTIKDIWVRTPAGWRNKKSIVLNARVRVDGKVQKQ